MEFSSGEAYSPLTVDIREYTAETLKRQCQCVPQVVVI